MDSGKEGQKERQKESLLLLFTAPLIASLVGTLRVQKKIRQNLQVQEKGRWGIFQGEHVSIDFLVERLSVLINISHVFMVSFCNIFVICTL